MSHTCWLQPQGFQGDYLKLRQNRIPEEGIEGQTQRQIEKAAMIKETQIGQGGGKGTELDKLRAHAGAIRHQRPDIGRDYAGCHKYGQQEAYFGGVETTVVKKNTPR